MNKKALDSLTQKHPAFRSSYDAFGAPPDWSREQNFATLIHIILEQQVSLASALAAFNKLQEILNPITPEAFLRLSDDQLKGAYFSRQKIRYGRELAKAVVQGTLNLKGFENLSDDEARAELTKITGIGRWSADIYLMMALSREDIWPKGDVALASAAKDVFNLEVRPSQDELENMAERWSPYRSLAAKLLWHYYLSTRKAK